MNKTFGEFLKQKRLEKSLTQKELSKLLIISESAVSKWEKDVAHPDITLLPKLAEILGVTEHELITASIDETSRAEKSQAKKWRTLSVTWSLFFYISYALALIPCFIVDLAINKALTWFWIVFSALILAFSFTNLPKLITKHKLILVPLSNYLALCLLLGVCCLYTGGNWFFIPAVAVLFGLIIIFMPIYICKYKVFEKVRKYADFVSVTIDFVMLNILLLVINAYTIINNATGFWYLKPALPIVLIIYAILNILLSVRFLKINKLLKTSIILFLCNIFIYAVPPFIKVSNINIQSNIDEINIFKADLSRWILGVTIQQNIHLIICLSILFIGLLFFIGGLIVHCNKKHK
ncbi:MAG: helix-turn-helix domain-containing protein [Clostridia bacterium]|nr:helix-turn-helix domain-containing protein [Clostridia bacterium]